MLLRCWGAGKVERSGASSGALWPWHSFLKLIRMSYNCNIYGKQIGISVRTSLKSVRTSLTASGGFAQDLASYLSSNGTPWRWKGSVQTELDDLSAHVFASAELIKVASVPMESLQEPLRNEPLRKSGNPGTNKLLVDLAVWADVEWFSKLLVPPESSHDSSQIHLVTENALSTLANLHHFMNFQLLGLTCKTLHVAPSLLAHFLTLKFLLSTLQKKISNSASCLSILVILKIGKCGNVSDWKSENIEKGKHVQPEMIGNRPLNASSTSVRNSNVQ